MGVHISIVDTDCNPHPTWSWLREAGDRDLASALVRWDGARIYRKNEDGDDTDDWRPASLSDLRDHLTAAGVMTARGQDLLACLADDTRWLVHISF